jgi:hypothetical protein
LSSQRLSPKNEPGTDVFQNFGGLWAAVCGKVVQYHDVALVQGRGQLGFDIKVVDFRLIAPPITQGASSLLWRKAAIKVCVF